MGISKLFVVSFAFVLICSAEDRFQSGELQGFLKPPTEHTINRFEKIITTKDVSGVILSKTGSAPLANVVFELRGPGTDPHIISAKTDQKGRFHVKQVRSGEYTFKVTRDGFQSLVGTLFVSKRATATEKISLALDVGA